jgi:uncharacterized membrane protein
MLDTRANGARSSEQNHNTAASPGMTAERPDQLLHNIEEVIRLSQRDRLAMSRSDRIADLMTAFSGSMLFLWLHAVWFGVWIVINNGWLGPRAFDPFPFGLLTMVVSLEAIFLSTFVLISQNRQAMQADRRAKVNMQVDVLAEQEATKLIQMVAEIHEHLGIRMRNDPELSQLKQPTTIERLADTIDAVEQRVDPKGARGPDSAVDTEA